MSGKDIDIARKAHEPVHHTDDEFVIFTSEKVCASYRAGEQGVAAEKDLVGLVIEAESAFSVPGSGYGRERRAFEHSQRLSVSQRSGPETGVRHLQTGSFSGLAGNGEKVGIGFAHKDGD